MPIIRQSFIQRTDLHANRDILYVFGDNEAGMGLGGQAAEMRGEPNAVGIPTKAKPKRMQDSYWSDADLDRVRPLIEAKIARLKRHLTKGGIVVVPLDGIGTGRAQLRRRAPAIAAFIQHLFEGLSNTYRYS